MERKTVAALGGTAALGIAAGGITLNGAGISINLADTDPRIIVILALALVMIGMLALGVYGLFKGWIVPKPYYDSALARAVAAEGATDRLAERVTKLTDTNSVQAHAIEKISAGADTTIKIMSALQDARATAVREGAE